MGRVKEMAVEREGVLDMMTSTELAQELVNRLESEFPTIANDEDAYGAHILISEINAYIKRSS